MSFSLCLFIIFLATFIAFCLGYGAGFNKGTLAGWDEGYEFGTSESELEWQITVKGAAALDAEREPLTELTLYPTPMFPKEGGIEPFHPQSKGAI